MSLRSFALSLLVLLSLCLAPSVAHAIKRPTCADPFDAVDSVWRWQQKGEQVRLDYASACFDPTGRTPAQRQHLAELLVVVFDHEPTIIDLDRLREMKPDHVDPQTRDTRVVLHERFPRVTIERRNNRWIWPKSSLDFVEQYYVDRLSGLDRFIERIPSWLQGELLGVAYWQLLALGLLLGLGLLLRKLLQVVVRALLRKRRGRLGPKRMTAWINAVASPGATLLIALLLRVGYPQLRLHADAALAVQVAVRMLLTVSLVWAGYRSIDLLAVSIEQRAERTGSKLDDQLVNLTRKTLKAVVVVAGGLLLLQMVEVNVPSLLAGLGIGGLAIAFAAKETLSNLIAGVALLLDGPFQIGDYIEVEGVAGTVEEVGMRSTRIRTFQDTVVVLPNAKLGEAKIDNYQKRRFRRTQTTLTLRFGTTAEQVQAFVEGIRAIIRANPLTRKDSYEAHLAAIVENGLQIFVQFFLRVEDWNAELRERHCIFLECLRLAERLGIRYALPAQALHHEEPDGPAAAHAAAVPPTVERLRTAVESFGPDGEAARPGGPVVTHGFHPTPEPAPESSSGGRPGAAGTA